MQVILLQLFKVKSITYMLNIINFNNLLKIKIKRKENIDSLFFKIRPQYPYVKSISWRVDVSISTSSLSRTLEPTIILQMHLSNDQKQSFELSLSSFHLLRFNVAFVLKEIEDLLNRPTGSILS